MISRDSLDAMPSSVESTSTQAALRGPKARLMALSVECWCLWEGQDYNVRRTPDWMKRSKPDASLDAVSIRRTASASSSSAFAVESRRKC
jgi:hypothetical protein